VTEPVRCRWILIQRRVGVVSIELEQGLTGGTARKRAAMGCGVEEEVLDAVKQKRWRIVSSSAWYKRQLGRWPGTPGRRGGRGGGLRGRRRLRARMAKRETRRGCLGGFYEWCEFYGELYVGLNRPGGRERGWPDRGRGMAMTRSAVISSGRDGRGSMGGVCRWWGDVGGALALQGDDRQDGEQWHLRTWSGDFFSSGLWGSAQRESRVWGHRG
jgi:hypothetical protein